MSFSHWLSETIRVASQSGVSVHGDPGFGAIRSVRAKVEMGEVRGEESREREVVLYTQERLQPDDLIWLPGEDHTDTAAARRPSSVERQRSKSGGRTVFRTVI